MYLNHARHNSEVCHFLYDNTEYNDWIVTTAYYSAIYFVSHFLFPGKFQKPNSEDIKHYPSFHAYCKDLSFNTSKHEAREDLVQEHIPEIYSDFKTLKDSCQTARYDDYQVQNEIVASCIDALNVIREFCEKKER